MWISMDLGMDTQQIYLYMSFNNNWLILKYRYLFPIDLSKAFDTLGHDIFSQHLLQYRLIKLLKEDEDGALTYHSFS